MSSSSNVSSGRSTSIGMKSQQLSDSIPSCIVVGGRRKKKEKKKTVNYTIRQTKLLSNNVERSRVRKPRRRPSVAARKKPKTGPAPVEALAGPPARRATLLQQLLLYISLLYIFPSPTNTHTFSSRVRRCAVYSAVSNKHQSPLHYISPSVYIATLQYASIYALRCLPQFRRVASTKRFIQKEKKNYTIRCLHPLTASTSLREPNWGLHSLMWAVG